MTLIETQNLAAGYGRKVVLENVTFSFTGGAVGLLGPNGAGKSTLIKTVLGLIAPLGGVIRVMDQDVPRHATAVRSRIGYMPETEALIPGINAVNFVAYMAELSGLPRGAAMERSHEVLQYVGLGESRYRNLETYSMGMKQRAKLAQAIVHDPALLLLDEPTNGMDPPGRLEMLDLVRDLSRKKDMSVVLCSHLLKDVESIADEIIVLGNGRIVAKRMNKPDEGARVRIYSVRVKGSRSDYLAAATQLGAKPIDGSNSSELLLELAAEASPSILFSAASQSGCTIQRLEEQTENLQDLFEQAIGELGHAHL